MKTQTKNRRTQSISSKKADTRYASLYSSASYFSYAFNQVQTRIFYPVFRIVKQAWSFEK